jgi:hypothetical protein
MWFIRGEPHMLMMLAIGRVFAADCPEATTNAQVSSELQAALLSYAVMDEEAFATSSDKAVSMVGCLGELATPQVAAELHRVRGVHKMLTGDAEGATLAMAAALGLEPDHSLSPTLAPEGGNLANAYVAAGKMAPLARVALDLDGYTLHVDGKPTGTRPEGPYVFQVGGSAPSFSAYVASGSPTLPEGLQPSPSEPVAVAPMPSPKPTQSAAPSSSAGTVEKKKGKGLLWAGVASGGVAAGLYGTSVAGRLSYDASPSSGSLSLTNGAFFGSVGTAALSAGLLTTFLVTR